MKLYLAPMEGITYRVVRNAYAHNFKGIDKYFTPFIPAAKKFGTKIKRDIDPELNKDVYLIPQVISNKAEEMFELEEKLMAYGYEEYNLNLGCPSGTVVSKKRGSGFLGEPEELDRFLDSVYSNTRMKLSLKTRIGLNDVGEWDRLLDIYKKYPIYELIIHPRLKVDMYRGTPRYEAFLKACDSIRVPLCYNGDIFSLEGFKNIESKFLDTEIFMIGRGVLKRPWLIEEISGCCGSGETRDVMDAADTEADGDIRKKLRSFHDEILNGFQEIFSGEKDTVMHMKEIWTHLGESFPGAEKELKRLKKSKTLIEFKSVADYILSMEIS